MGVGIADWGLGLPPERLHVSVFAGDEADGLPADEEAAELWRRFVPADRISRFDKKDNRGNGCYRTVRSVFEIHFDGLDGCGGHLVMRMILRSSKLIWCSQFTVETTARWCRCPQSTLIPGWV